MKRLQNILTEDDVKEAAFKADGFLTRSNELHEILLPEFTIELNKLLENILRDI